AAAVEEAGARVAARARVGRRTEPEALQRAQEALRRLQEGVRRLQEALRRAQRLFREAQGGRRNASPRRVLWPAPVPIARPCGARAYIPPSAEAAGGDHARDRGPPPPPQTS
ncbi:unnamed protein product, partial [Prorocentrum cordatum]